MQSLRDQIDAQLREIQRLSGTLIHFRTWAAQLHARQQVFGPETTRPARRVYVGNLPHDITEAELRQAINELMVQMYATSAPGFPITSCKLYPAFSRSWPSPADPSWRPDSEGRPMPRNNSIDSSQPPMSPGSTGAPHPHPPTTTENWQGPAGSQGQIAQAPPCIPTPQVQEKSFAFLEFRTPEEASNCMALDGVRLHDSYLKIRRPNNYDAGTAMLLGPSEPNPYLDLSSLDIMRTVVVDGPNKIFLGGLPCDWTEEQVKDMLLPFGPLRAFNLVMDRTSGKSKGYAFCEYADVDTTDTMICTLHGRAVGTKFLTVKRALAPHNDRMHFPVN